MIKNKETKLPKAKELTPEQKAVQEFLPKLDTLLKENNMAIRPFLSINENGIIPNASVLFVPEKKENDK